MSNKCCCQETEYNYENICQIRDFLREFTDLKPKVGVICGSGLGSLAEVVIDPLTIAFDDIPNFPKTTAPGHIGNFVFGYISEVPVVCMNGRFHYYEGYSLATCVMPIRLMKLLGITHLILSNAAGGLNPIFKPGDLMFQKDHFNIMGISGHSPLRGFNDPRWGSRFFSMIGAYDANILNAAKEIVKDMGIDQNVHEGIYTCAGGPSYETVCEARAFRALGVDAMGMSTVHEVTAARHCDIKCFAISLITNICSQQYEDAEDICSEQVLEAGKQQKDTLKVLVKRVVEHIGGESCR